MLVTALIIVLAVGLVFWENCPKCHDGFTRMNLEAIEQYIDWVNAGFIDEAYAVAYIEWHLSHVLKAQPNRYGAVSYAGITVTRHSGKTLALSPVRA